jgi:hypothetical protein
LENRRSTAPSRSGSARIARNARELAQPALVRARGDQHRQRGTQCDHFRLRPALLQRRATAPGAGAEVEHTAEAQAAPDPQLGEKRLARRHAAVGIELSFSHRFSDSFAAFLNLGHIDAKFNAFDDQGRPQALAGNRFRLTPKNTASLGFDWRMNLADGGSLYLRPYYTWRSQVFFEEDNAPGIEQAAYGLLNLTVGWRINRHWDLRLYAQNLADKKYLIDAGNTGALFGIPTFIPGAPRFYGARVGLRVSQVRVGPSAPASHRPRRTARGAYRKFKRPFRPVCRVGGGRASAGWGRVLGADRTSVSGISASRGHAAAL